MTLGHNRYSTNTLSNFFRVQPFSILGHNGEINTIAKLRDQAEMIDVPLTAGGSDSQDLNRTLETLLVQYNYSLFEAMEILFPPIINEIKLYETPLQDLYTYIREAWGHFAQGPAGIISRFKDEAVFSVDSLGLRPVWKVETESSYIFSSEPGVVSPTKYVAEPKPLAPGEKVGLKWNEQDELVLYEHDKYQIQVYNRFKKRIDTTNYHLNLSIPETKKSKGYVILFKLKRNNTSLSDGTENIFNSLNRWQQKALSQYAHLGMTHHLAHLILIDEISLTSLKKV